MKPLHIGKVKDQRTAVYKVEPIVGPNTSGITSVPDGYAVADIEVLVDVRALVADLGLRAMRNRQGTAKLRGAVVIKAVNVRRIAQGGA